MTAITVSNAMTMIYAVKYSGVPLMTDIMKRGIKNDEVSDMEKPSPRIGARITA